MKTNYKQYAIYLIRWQLSTPILAVALIVLASMNKIYATIIANLIGGLIFFWVDKFIFTTPLLKAQWEVLDNITCHDCDTTARGYRLIKTANYDKTKATPQFRCESCSHKKTQQLRQQGIDI
jgi:DNA-directed RNA polymerase subunit RPC12/RpoP